MSVQPAKKGRWAVRWREAGRHRSLTFATKPEAEEFDRALRSAREQGRHAQRVRDALQKAAA